MTWLEVVGIVVSSVAGVATIVGLIARRLSKKFETSVKNTVEPMMAEYSRVTQEHMQEIKENLTREMVDLKIRLDEYKETSDETDAKMMKSLMDLSRDSINRAYKYFTEQGEIDEHTMYCIQQLGESYTGLGGNSFACDEIEGLKELLKACKHKKKSHTTEGKVGVSCEAK